MTDDRDRIISLFNGRCGRCMVAPAVTVHEIIPKGINSKEAAMDEQNRIALCAACHDWAHLVGTNKSIPELIACREKALGITR